MRDDNHPSIPALYSVHESIDTLDYVNSQYLVLGLVSADCLLTIEVIGRLYQRSAPSRSYSTELLTSSRRRTCGRCKDKAANATLDF